MIAPGAEVGENVSIGAYAVIHERVRIAPGCEIQDGAVLGKEPRLGPRSSAPELDDDALLVIEAGAVIGTGAIVFAGAHIGAGAIVGDRTSIREGAQLGAESVLGTGATLGHHVRVGERARIFNNTVLAPFTIVEEEADLAVGVGTTALRWGGDDGTLGGPIFRKGCRIGVNAVVFGGVEVGAGAVVGAGSIVREDVPAGATVVGSPARVVT